MTAGLSQIAAVGLGAMLGAWARWGLGALLNGLWPLLPLGTLAANVAGGYGMGVAMALFAGPPDWPPELRAAVVVGFLGAFTTFSTFSAEIYMLFERGQTGWAGLLAGAHLAGSLLALALGVWHGRALARLLGLD
jgi:CrcB protein